MEQTLLVLKPDAVMRRGVGATVLERILEALPDVTFRGFLEITVSKSLAEQHYAIHEGKFFYPWLLQFIQCGKVVATVLEGRNVVQRLREVLGATFVEKADSESLRGKYGIVGGVNVAHASDEPANAVKEIDLWRLQAKLDTNIDGLAFVRNYINKWREIPVVATEQIRNLCLEYTQTFTDRDRFQQSIAKVLVEECPDWSDQDIQKLADAILGNMDLDRDKE